MSDYIRRADAVDAVAFGITIASAFNSETGERIDLFVKENDELRKAIKRIHDLPSADIAPVTDSRWVKTDDGAKCEICGREAVYQIVDDHWEYEPWCPHCGARMDNEEYTHAQTEHLVKTGKAYPEIAAALDEMRAKR